MSSQHGSRVEKGGEPMQTSIQAANHVLAHMIMSFAGRSQCPRQHHRLDMEGYVLTQVSPNTYRHRSNAAGVGQSDYRAGGERREVLLPVPL